MEATIFETSGSHGEDREELREHRRAVPKQSGGIDYKERAKDRYDPTVAAGAQGDRVERERESSRAEAQLAGQDN